MIADVTQSRSLPLAVISHTREVESLEVSREDVVAGDEEKRGKDGEEKQETMGGEFLRVSLIYWHACLPLLCRFPREPGGKLVLLLLHHYASRLFKHFAFLNRLNTTFINIFERIQC